MEFERVDTADTMRSALLGKKFDLVLCDYVLPGFSVQSALQILEEHARKLPFIVVSGIVRTADVVQVLRSGADDFIEKHDLARLVPAVEHALRSAEERRSLSTVETQLRQAQKMEAVGRLTGGLAHDFNNLLAVIQGNAELLADRIGDVDHSAQTILRAAERGAELTQRLLAFSRQQPLHPQAIDLSALIGDISDLLARTLGETVEITIGGSPNLWRALVDQSQMENALINLAINARDAMPGGGMLTIDCSNVRLDENYTAWDPGALPGDYVLLAVSDTGVGMSGEVQAQVFEPFFTTKDLGQGTGLGLSMVYGFAKQSGGHIAIVSEVGRGTTVKLYLPRSKSVAPAKLTENSNELLRGRGEMVLVIEDDDGVRGLAVKMLENLGYRASAVADAAEGLHALAKKERVDLVLSDVVLPGGMNGPDFAEEARRHYPDLKIIFMSGYPDKLGRSGGPLGPGVVLLNKPFRRKQLARELREALD